MVRKGAVCFISLNCITQLIVSLWLCLKSLTHYSLYSGFNVEDYTVSSPAKREEKIKRFGHYSGVLLIASSLEHKA